MPARPWTTAAVALADSSSISAGDLRDCLCDHLGELPAHAAVGPATKVLILTTFDLDEYVFAGLKAGASGFLLKDAPPAGLLTAIRPSPAATRSSPPQRPADSSTGSPAARSRPTARAGCPARQASPTGNKPSSYSSPPGDPNHEIADDLHLSEGTVKVHVGRILAKLGLRDRVQAVVLAYESGLITPGS